MERRIDTVEEKIAFQEHALNELSDVVYEQQKQINTLQLQLEQLKERIKSMGSESSRPHSMEDEKPPHY